MQDRCTCGAERYSSGPEEGKVTPSKEGRGGEIFWVRPYREEEREEVSDAEAAAARLNRQGAAIRPTLVRAYALDELQERRLFTWRGVEHGCCEDLVQAVLCSTVR